MNIPPDDNNPPGSSSNLGAGLGFDPNMSAHITGEVSLMGQNKSKTPYIIVGVLIAAGAGFFTWQSKKHRDERVQHAKFMEQFQLFEHDDLIKFWQCTLGPKADGTILNSPDQVTTQVDVQFASDFRNYPNKLGDECAAIAKDMAGKASATVTLPQYTSAVDAYGKALVAMSDSLVEWAKNAPAQVQSKMIAKNLDDYSAAWHAYASGAPAPEVISYDGFLHCAVPDADTKYKDDTELATYVFNQCKQPGFAEKLNGDCGKLLIDKPAAPTKGWKTALQKLGPGDANAQTAFDKCLTKARKGKLKGNLAPVGESWVAFRTAREAVLKIGADALKD